AEDRIADPLGLRSQLDHVDLVKTAVADDLLGRLLGDETEPALHLGERRLDVEIFLRPVLVRPDVAHLVAGEDALEDCRIDDRGCHGACFSLVSVGIQCPARCKVRSASRTTGRSTIRPSTRATPGDAASAARTRRAQSRACALGASAT